MADTTALKNRIRAAIKANDNQEITGPVLQQALLDMVDELNGATETEANARQSGDSTLQQGINTERQQRQDADTALGQRITDEIRQEAQAREDAFDKLDLIDAAGSQVTQEAIDLTLRKNDGSEEDPDWQVLCHLLIPSATTQKAGLMSVAMRNLLYNLRNAGYAFGGIAVTDTNPGVPAANCFYIVRGAGTYTYFKNADNESIVIENDGIYVLTYESVENNCWEWNCIVRIDDKIIPNSENLAKTSAVYDAILNSDISLAANNAVVLSETVDITGGMDNANLFSINIPQGLPFIVKITSLGGLFNGSYLYFNGDKSSTSDRVYISIANGSYEGRFIKNYDVTKIGFVTGAQFVTTSGNIKIEVVVESTVFLNELNPFSYYSGEPIEIAFDAKTVTWKNGTILFIADKTNNTPLIVRNNSGEDKVTSFIVTSGVIHHKRQWWCLYYNRTDNNIYLAHYSEPIDFKGNNIVVLGLGTLAQPEYSFYIGGAVIIDTQKYIPNINKTQFDSVYYSYHVTPFTDYGNIPLEFDTVNKTVTFKNGAIFYIANKNSTYPHVVRNNTGSDIVTQFIEGATPYDRGIWQCLYYNIEENKFYNRTFDSSGIQFNENIIVIGVGQPYKAEKFITGGPVKVNGDIFQSCIDKTLLDVQLDKLIKRVDSLSKRAGITVSKTVSIAVGEDTDILNLIEINIPRGTAFEIKVSSDTQNPFTASVVIFNLNSQQRYFTDGNLPWSRSCVEDYDISYVGFRCMSNYILENADITVSVIIKGELGEIIDSLNGQVTTLNGQVGNISQGLQSLRNTVENLPVSPEFAFEGKKLSVVGDSISTFAGYIPQGYAAWYPNGGQDVNSVDKTWWKMLCDRTHMTVGTIAAWSGSTVCGNATSTTSAEAGCSTKRVNDLALNGTPDIIIVYMGYNDIKNGSSSRPLGTYEGNSAYPTETSNMTSFSEAYATMLKKIINTYPNAIVMCCTLLPNPYKNKNRNQDDPENFGYKFPYTTEEPHTMQDYNDRIRKIARNFGLGIIDLARCGITWENWLNYTDDAAFHVHPSYAGQKMISYKAEQDLINYAKTLELNTVV